jgi:hypothetical protein
VVAARVMATTTPFRAEMAAGCPLLHLPANTKICSADGHEVEAGAEGHIESWAHERASRHAGASDVAFHSRSLGSQLIRATAASHMMGLGEKRLRVTATDIYNA